MLTLLVIASVYACRRRGHDNQHYHIIHCLGFLPEIHEAQQPTSSFRDLSQASAQRLQARELWKGLPWVLQLERVLQKCIQMWGCSPLRRDCERARNPANGAAASHNISPVCASVCLCSLLRLQMLKVPAPAMWKVSSTYEHHLSCEMANLPKYSLND